MTSIALYFEGGGDSRRSGQDLLRQGFNQLLERQKKAAAARRFFWRVVACGGRQQTYDAFVNAVTKKTADIVALVVDAEDPVIEPTPKGRVAHLEKRDGWELKSVDASCVHLMTQCMEAWIVADPDKLTEYYGKDFNRNALPKRIVLDEEPKKSLYNALEAATKETQKGRYAKVRHASELLKRVRPEVVAKRCLSFHMLTQWLDSVIAGQTTEESADLFGS